MNTISRTRSFWLNFAYMNTDVDVWVLGSAINCVLATKQRRLVSQLENDIMTSRYISLEAIPNRLEAIAIRNSFLQLNS